MDNKGIKPLWVIIICVICIAIVSPISWMLGKSSIDSQPNTNEKSMPEKQNDTTDSTEVDTTDNNFVAKEEIYASYDKDKIVEITENGKVLVTMTNASGDGEKIEKQEIIRDVKATSIVHVGQSDVCEGNAKLIFILENGKVSYLDIDMLVCEGRIAVHNIPNLNNIVEVTEKEEASEYQNDPPFYTVYAKDKDGNIIDISSEF